MPCPSVLTPDDTEGSGRAPEEYIREVVAGWFLDQPLGKVCFGNAAAWTAWAFFGKDVKYMTTVSRCAADAM